MSATNRGAERKPYDFYATPEATAHALIRWLEAQQLEIGTVLDPAAGDGALLRQFDCYLHAYEIRPECAEPLVRFARTTIGDALAEDPNRDRVFDLVACNPPFSLAREFVTAYRYVGRTSAFLLRLGFLASQSRAPWWAEDPPAHVLVLPSRPSFTGDGKSDSADYGWIVWRGKTPRGYTRLDWLVTP
jgi:hypothetical protein